MKLKKIKTINKKAEGFLESEVLRVVIATICIFLLAVLAYKLYTLFTKKTALEQAKETLNQLVSKMNALKQGEKDEFMVVSPKNWVLMSNGEQICICSFESKGFSFFKHENRENAFQTCLIEGFCSKIKNNISQFDFCGWGTFKSCLDFKNLPLKIYLEKRDTVYLKTKVEAAIANRLESILNYKKDENSKTIRELITDLIPLQGGGNFFQFIIGTGPVAENIKKQKEITNSFESYLDKIDTKKEFNIERDKLAWKMIMYKLNDQGQIQGAWIPVGDKYLVPARVGDISDVSSSYIDIEGYRLILQMYQGK